MPLKNEGKARWTFEASETDLRSAHVPELMMLGYDHFTEAMPLSHHKHDQAYEFVFAESGKVTWEVDGTFHETRSGEFFHTRPDEWHRARMDYMEPCSIWWMILKDPLSSATWLGTRDEESKEIAERLQKLPRTFPSNPQVKYRLAQLKRTLSDEPDPLHSLKARHTVLDIVLTLLEPAAHQRIPEDLHDALLNIGDKIRRTPEQHRSNLELAAEIGVSESHFYRLFRNTFGQSPASYMERSRIEYASRLLKDSDIPITRLALDLGFKTSQHFSTVFKKFTGMTPSKWREFQG